MPANYKSFYFFNSRSELWRIYIYATAWFVCLRHDEGAEEGDGVSSGAVALEFWDEQALDHLRRRGLHVAQFPKVTGSH